MILAHLGSIDYAVAMVHPDAQKGDKVFYIQGCSAPVVLRRAEAREDSNEKHDMVIGGAYLHEDSRDGFLSKEMDNMNSSMKEIFLC